MVDVDPIHNVHMFRQDCRNARASMDTIQTQIYKLIVWQLIRAVWATVVVGPTRNAHRRAPTSTLVHARQTMHLQAAQQEEIAYPSTTALAAMADVVPTQPVLTLVLEWAHVHAGPTTTQYQATRWTASPSTCVLQAMVDVV